MNSELTLDLALMILLVPAWDLELVRCMCWEISFYTSHIV